jgi:hypothetical protein
MKKVLAVAGLLFASSFALGVAFLAPSDKPASAAPVAQQPVPAPEPAPVVLETSAVLIVADAPKAAPKPRPVSARPRPAAKGQGGLVDCGNAKVRTVEETALGTTVRYCHN